MRALLPDTGEPGFGVYVHWPFCAAKCPYCDFNSHVRHQPVDQERFTAAFLKEMATMRAAERTEDGHQRVSRRRYALADEAGSTVDSDSRTASPKSWHMPDGIEITMEANPSSVEAERFRGYRAAGVNRVSLGVQALNDRDLKFLGRLHDVADALKAIKLARDIFPRMSFDLIYARPNQTVEEWERELKRGDLLCRRSPVALPADDRRRHALLRPAQDAGKLIVPDDDQSALLYEATQDITAL
jgi:coproporphyrinogen III oxidase-like Fe-S oxidoreductase